MGEKICPISGMSCDPACAWYSNDLTQCVMLAAGHALHSLMMSLTGEWKDQPASRIASYMEDVAENTKGIESSVDALR